MAGWQENRILLHSWLQSHSLWPFGYRDICFVVTGLQNIPDKGSLFKMILMFFFLNQRAGIISTFGKVLNLQDKSQTQVFFFFSHFSSFFFHPSSSTHLCFFSVTNISCFFNFVINNTTQCIHHLNVWQPLKVEIICQPCEK